jgi:glycosyltransferase involved in cell wall biosynthesis
LGSEIHDVSIRVAHVVETLDLGGLEKLITEFARHTDRTRFAPMVVTIGRRGLLADEVETLDCPVISLNRPPGVRSRVWSITQMARIFRRERVGVVHTHSEGPLLFGAPAARLAKVPRVVHTRHHGPDLGSSRRALTGMAFAARWVDCVACVADDGARRAADEGIDASKIQTIWNGIDLDRFAFRGPAPGGPAVVVARLSPEKDVETLLRATSIVARQMPEFRLEIAGDGPNRSGLEVLAKELNLGERARFLGRVDDVPALLGRASMLVLPSRMEGISLTLLEAMARGLPCVATRVGGNPEVVIDDQTGLLVPPGNPKALAHAIQTLWNDPERAEALGRAGRARAERHFDIRRTVATYESIYQTNIAEARSA